MNLLFFENFNIAINRIIYTVVLTSTLRARTARTDVIVMVYLFLLTLSAYFKIAQLCAGGQDRPPPPLTSKYKSSYYGICHISNLIYTLYYI